MLKTLDRSRLSRKHQPSSRRVTAKAPRQERREPQTSCAPCSRAPTVRPSGRRAVSGRPRPTLGKRGAREREALRQALHRRLRRGDRSRVIDPAAPRRPVARSAASAKPAAAFLGKAGAFAASAQAPAPRRSTSRHRWRSSTAAEVAQPVLHNASACHDSDAARHGQQSARAPPRAAVVATAGASIFTARASRVFADRNSSAGRGQGPPPP